MGRPCTTPNGKSLCHPQQVHIAKGLCRYCYNKRWMENPGAQRKKNAANRQYARQNRNKESLRHKRYRESPNGKKALRKRWLRSAYGLSLEQFEAIFKAQNGVCALCRKARKLFVDHDHNSKKIRGLLCIRCNTMLGALGDTAQAARRLVRYLEE